MNNKNLLIIVLALIIAVGGYMFYKERNTTTIDLPGDNKIEITE
jgi:hypothetical protein